MTFDQAIQFVIMITSVIALTREMSKESSHGKKNVIIIIKVFIHKK